ncbi:gastrula zinc finger protein XlCGF57.1 isoform X2 [Dendroctonus ponderosae]|uniref:Protein krueppel n=1 Tax=Dendroctonus ponderosae TaxID=77166 RepID=A0AAR5PR42_DENPD|nr:gastrula zinc finger protein XlCGF57.1 isoform X2 [Dendroctonus ponderosae]
MRTWKLMDENMEIHYEKACRLCLKSSRNMFDMFTYLLQPSQISLVDFTRKLTDLKLAKGEFLPSNICTTCIECINSTHSFINVCRASDDILKKEETRREFRKIEQEALLDEHETGHFEEDAHLNEGGDLSEAVSADISGKSQTVEVIKLPEKMQEKYACSFCEVKFSNKLKFLTHQSLHDETKPFKCSSCLHSFSKEVKLHNFQIMKNQFLLIWVFNLQAHLRVHLRSHANPEEKKHSCPTCGKQFFYAYLLKQHEYKHSDQKPFPCSKCDKGCLTSENLRRHMKTHDENYTKKVYRCTVCRKIFPYPSSLSEHMKLHTGEKPHLCSICGKGFRQSGSLHFHQRIHTGYKPFKCEKCSEYFKSRSLLKVHMRKHTNERPFVCDTCGMAFRQSNDLKSHLRTHTGEKPVLCTLCGKRMGTTGQLTIHLRTHTREKPYTCATCYKSFATKSVLQKHHRIHTGERPYECSICHKSFNQSSTLKTHLNIHSSEKEKGDCNRRKRDCKKASRNPDKATVEIQVNDEVKVNTDVRTQFTVILPAPIPLLSTTD